MKAKFTILLLLARFSFNWAQTWQQTYGTNGYSAVSIEKTFDNTYVIAGGTNSSDGFLMKIDSIGSIIWSRSVSVTSGNTYLNHVKQAPDSSLILTGSFNGNAGLAKLSSTGNLLLARQCANSLQALCVSSSNFYLLGGEGGLRLSNTGTSIWEDHFQYSASEYARIAAITELPGGNFIGAGSGGILNESVFLVKLDANGDTIWTKFYGTTGCHFTDIISPTTGTFYTCGNQSSSAQTFVCKWDTTGNLIWFKSISLGFGSNAVKLINSHDGGILVAGNISSQGAGGSDMFLMKLDGSGNMTWLKTYGGSGNEYLSDAVWGGGKVLMVGSTDGFSTNTGAYVVCADTSGNTGCNMTIGSATSFSIVPSFYSSIQISNPNSTSALSINMATSIPTASVLCTTVNVNEYSSDTQSVFLYPNPSNGEFKITLESNATVIVTDILGQTVWWAEYSEGENRLDLNVPDGIYFISTSSRLGASTQQLIINK
jgi:hypothetical protein